MPALIATAPPKEWPISAARSVLHRLEKRQPGHRVEHAFAELVGHPVVEPRHRDSQPRQLLAQPHVEHPRAIETAERAADAQYGAARSFSRMHDYRNVAPGRSQPEAARPSDFAT